MTTTAARAAELVAKITALGISATRDPAQLTGLLPCVLVGPPTRASARYGADDVTWRLTALADPADQVTAWEQLDAMVDQLRDLWELAEPGNYALPNGTDPAPAYLLTFTETLEV